jgi:hypothetical protein
MISEKSCEPNDGIGMTRPSVRRRKNVYRLTGFYDPSGAAKPSWGPDAGPRKPMKMLTRAQNPLHLRSLP